MHLERQLKYDKEKSEIEKSVHEKDRVMKEKEAAHNKEKEGLRK